MKFVEDRSGNHLITSYGPGYLEVDHQVKQCSLMLTPDAIIELPDTHSVDDITDEHMSQLNDLKLQAVVIGSGKTHRFPDAKLSMPLLQQGIGVEAMDTGSACRTYNILISEGRNVAAILLQIED